MQLVKLKYDLGRSIIADIFSVGFLELKKAKMNNDAKQCNGLSAY